MSILRLTLVVVILLIIILYTLEFLRVFPSKTAISSTPYIIAIITYLVITDLTIYIFSLIVSPSTYKLDPRIQHYIEKELYLYISQQSIQLYIALVNKEELIAKDLLVIDIRVGEPPLNPSLGYLQESRLSRIQVLRSKFSSKINQAIIEVDVLFSIDTVNPRL